MNFSYNHITKIATVNLKVKAGSRNSAIEGFISINDLDFLKISINAPAEDGKANAAIIKMLSKILHIKQNQIKIIRGLSSNLKTLEIRDIEENYLHAITKKH